MLPLGPGLTVVTGETGAGKTMVVQGLGLLFGGRADAGRVRPDAPRAVVEGRLVLARGSAALDRAVDAGAELDDGALLVSRSVGADGRSRAHLGGRSVPVGVLGELAEQVLAVHGQSDQQRLLRPAQQRSALDRYAGPPVLRLRDRFRADWARWRDVRATLQQLRDEAAERARETELLRLGVAEVEQVAPQPGEDLALTAEIERLANADDLRAAAAGAQVALTGDEEGPRRHRRAAAAGGGPPGGHGGGRPRPRAVRPGRPARRAGAPRDRRRRRARVLPRVRRRRSRCGWRLRRIGSRR